VQHASRLQDLLVYPLLATSTSIGNDDTDYATYDSSGIYTNWLAGISHFIGRSEPPECNLNTTGYCFIGGIGIL